MKMNYQACIGEGMTEGRNVAESLELIQNILEVVCPSAKEKKIVSVWNILFTTGAKQGF